MKIIKERIIVDYGDDDIISIPIYPQYQKVLTTGGFKYQNDPCITCSNNLSLYIRYTQHNLLRRKLL